MTTTRSTLSSSSNVHRTVGLTRTFMDTFHNGSRRNTTPFIRSSEMRSKQRYEELTQTLFTLLGILLR